MSVQTIVLDRFTAVYGLPKSENISAFLGEYIQALHTTDKQLLSAGIDLLIKRHPMSTGVGIWPSPGAISAAVREAATNVDRVQRYGQPALEAPKFRQPTKAERARCADLMASFRHKMQEAAIAAEGERPELPKVDAGAWDAMPRRARSHYSKAEEAA